VTDSFIPFNRPYLTGREFEYMREAANSGQLAGDGPFTRRCHTWLERTVGCRRALLTHSCTGALEMAALLAEVGPGDEIVMPSYTFVSTANAFALRGATPVFVDIRPDTLNIDESLVEAALGPRTRVIVPVHYAGVACEMDAITAIAATRGLLVIEDAAQALGSRYRGHAVGALGHLAVTSFHETKNIISGEGGALLVNDERFAARAEIVREKGTDRTRYMRGEIDKYSWVDLGSSFLPGELMAAFLAAQVEVAAAITSQRLDVWTAYYERFGDLAARELIRRPVVPGHCDHNAHMFYVLVPDPAARTRVLEALNAEGIHAVFHYVPLHSSRAGRRFGRTVGDMRHTQSVSQRLIRLPLWVGMRPSDVDRIVEAVGRAIEP
jgi:dTDP-4-amino-4,6-dideoxygalactose transaminase